VNNLFPPALLERLTAARWFVATALLAMIAGGLIAAVTAHAPARLVVWMVAYLVLVVGVAQMVLGLGQALLPQRLPSSSWRAGEWLLFNAGNAGVVVGTLLGAAALVSLGTALFIIALVLFFLGVARAQGGWLLRIYQGLLAIVCIGALVGLLLSWLH